MIRFSICSNQFLTHVEITPRVVLSQMSPMWQVAILLNRSLKVSWRLQSMV